MNNPSFTVVPLKIFDFTLIDFYTLISLLKLDDILINLPIYTSYIILNFKIAILSYSFLILHHNPLRHILRLYKLKF